MSDRHEHDAEEFARRLASLTPTAAITRDRVLFEAGRNAGRKEARPWRYAASLLMVGVLGLSAFEAWGKKSTPTASKPPQQDERHPQPQLAQSTTETAPGPNAQPPFTVDANTYLQLRNLVLKSGVEALPRTATATLAPKKNETQQAADNAVDRLWWRLRVQQVEGVSL